MSVSTTRKGKKAKASSANLTHILLRFKALLSPVFGLVDGPHNCVIEEGAGALNSSRRGWGIMGGRFNWEGGVAYVKWACWEEWERSGRGCFPQRV